MTETEGLRQAALALVAAHEANRDALNGEGHPGAPHDRVLAPEGHDFGGGIVMHDLTGDCAACGGAQYGTEDVLHGALGDLREALGLERRPWEYHRTLAGTEPAR